MYTDIRRKFGEFLREESGPTATEYAVMFSILLLGLFVTIKAVGSKVNTNFAQASQGW